MVKFEILSTTPDFCKNCSNKHPDECEWCQYEASMVHPSKYQPILKGTGKGTVVGRFEKLAIKIGRLVDEKNQAYGDSANTSAEAFKLLYPNGIKPEQYKDMLLLIRIWDKMKRIATDKNALGENPFQDIAGYGILGMGEGDE